MRNALHKASLESTHIKPSRLMYGPLVPVNNQSAADNSPPARSEPSSVSLLIMHFRSSVIYVASVKSIILYFPPGLEDNLFADSHLIIIPGCQTRCNGGAGGSRSDLCSGVLSLSRVP